MLVLTRKRGEQVIIGDTITLRVLSIDSNEIGLSIQAPVTLAITSPQILKLNSRLAIGSNIVICPVRIRDKKNVRLGIEAPPDIRILRAEARTKIKPRFHPPLRPP